MGLGLRTIAQLPVSPMRQTVIAGKRKRHDASSNFQTYFRYGFHACRWKRLGPDTGMYESSVVRRAASLHDSSAGIETYRLGLTTKAMPLKLDKLLLIVLCDHSTSTSAPWSRHPTADPVVRHEHEKLKLQLP
jgi:hypothetical protein